MSNQNNARSRATHRRRRYGTATAADHGAGVALIPTLAQWVRVDDSTVGDGAVCASLTARVGSGMNDPADTQPVIRYNGIGTRKALEIGNNDYLQTTAALNLFNPWTVVVVLQVTTLGTQKYISGTEDGTQQLLLLNADNTFLLAANNSAQFGTATTNPTVLECYNAGAGSKQYQDGALLASQNSGTSGLFKKVRFGNNNTSGNMKIAEMMYFSDALSAPERATVSAYMTAQYGITMA